MSKLRLAAAVVGAALAATTTGRPLVLLHGGLMTIENFGALLPALAKTRQVIASRAFTPPVSRE